MLSGTLVTVIGLMPVGFAKSTAGEYAGNIFWIVAFALIASWIVAVVFTPYLGVKLLPDIKPVAGGHAAIYSTPHYERFRRMVGWAVHRKFIVAGFVALLFAAAAVGMAGVKQQFFPSSDRRELLVEVQLPEGSSIEVTSTAAAKVEAWLKTQPEAKNVVSFIGQGAPRFFLAYNPELPDPSFAKDRRVDTKLGSSGHVEATSQAKDRGRLGARGTRSRNPVCIRAALSISHCVPRHGTRSR